MTSQKILMAMGTRPEIIKMAPIYHELKRHGAQPILLHTGQHTDMAASLYDLFDMVPDIAIDLRRRAAINDNQKPHTCPLANLSSQLLQSISEVMMGIDASAVLVHGDTSSALMSAMAAFYQKRPIAHIEAGLRSHNEYNPFPEEMNRVLIARLARWHFSPTATTRQNLLDEGIADARIHVVGNTIVEAARLGAAKLATYRVKHHSMEPDLIGQLAPQLREKRMLMVTVHRRENQAENIRPIARAVLEIMQKYPDIMVVWPVHPNPVVMHAVYEALQDLPASVSCRLHLTKPLDYPVLLWVLQHAWLVLTDSGGIQEEAVALNTPVLVLRDTTERPEIIAAGAGLLIGTQQADIISHVDTLLHHPSKYSVMCQVENPYGDGLTASRICHILMTKNTAEGQHSHAA